jgi:dihydroorotate dehydrogenase electron transfer subunit
MAQITTSIQEDAWIMDHTKLAQDTFRLRLNSSEIAKRAKPGQFVMLRVSDGLDPLLRRPFSLHAIVPDAGAIEILYRIVGKGTWRLSQSPMGARINLVGPLGNCFQLPPEHSSLVALVAGGIGIAPLFALLQSLAETNYTGAVHLFYGARTRAELLPPEAFDAFQMTVHWSTDDGTLGYSGRVTELLGTTMAGDLPLPSAVYSCGPLAMQYGVAKWSLRLGIAAQLSLESFMACGVGACLGCALPAVRADDPSLDHYVHVCKDGPIFSPGSIQWQKLQMLRTPPPLIFLSS